MRLCAARDKKTHYKLFVSGGVVACTYYSARNGVSGFDAKAVPRTFLYHARPLSMLHAASTQPRARGYCIRRGPERRRSPLNPRLSVTLRAPYMTCAAFGKPSMAQPPNLPYLVIAQQHGPVACGLCFTRLELPRTEENQSLLHLECDR